MADRVFHHLLGDLRGEGLVLQLGEGGLVEGIGQFADGGGDVALALGVIGSALAFLCYYRALRLAGAGNVSLVTLMIAPVSVVLGALFFGESLTLADYAGFGLLAAGLLVIDGRLLSSCAWGLGQKSA